MALAGAPTISELSGKSLPSVTSAFAPTRQFAPMRAGLQREEREKSEALQHLYARAPRPYMTRLLHVTGLERSLPTMA